MKKIHACVDGEIDMEERIIKFISALRASGVRVSMAETTDAFNAVNRLGVRDREVFRLSLRTTLVKDASSLNIFDELFPLFFQSGNSPPLMNVEEDLTPEEVNMLVEALQKYKDHLKEMLDRLIKGKPLSQQELEQLSRLTGLHQIDDMRYRDWLVRKMEKALEFPEVRQAVKELMDILAQMGMNKERVEQLQKLLLANQQQLQNQLNNYVGQKIADNLSDYNPQEGIEELLNRPFSALSDKDMERLRDEVLRLAAALRTRVALRQKRAKTGQFDAKATFRANLKHGAIPIKLKHKDHTLKPKIVAMCDISTSMRPCSELMLSLLFALQDQIKKTYSFAFIDHLEYISPEFVGREVRQSVTSVLKRMPPGHYNTDLGNSLKDFTDHYMDTIDKRVTVILVGDARNNYNNPRIDLMHKIAQRSNRIIWINPEAPALWGTGDSDMLKYAPHCNAIFQVKTLADLTRAVDRLLS